MQDAMVTARMSKAKKELGARKLAALGSNPSRFINDCYDFVIANDAMPVGTGPQEGERSYGEAEIAEARAWLEALSSTGPGASCFSTMTDGEIRQERLIARGLATEEDFC